MNKDLTPEKFVLLMKLVQVGRPKMTHEALFVETLIFMLQTIDEIRKLGREASQ